MPTYQSSASISATRERVWNTLADVTKWHEWTPTILKVEALDSRELQVGTRFKVHQPKLRPATWTVTACERSAGFTWESRMPGMLMTAEHILDVTGEALTNVSLKFSFSGPLGIVVGILSRKLVQSYLNTEAASLRDYVEGRGRQQ